MKAKRDGTLTGINAVWHECYCRWYDHDRAGHRLRAAVWGWATNRAARWTR